MGKKILLIFIFTTSYIFSETQFGGSAEISLLGNIRENDYSSIANPDNINGVKDISISPSLIFDISNYDELTNFEGKFSLNSYPVGMIFYSLSQTEIEQNFLKEIFQETGESVNTFELERLFIDLQLLDSFSISLGRKPFLMGFGYGWNPTDNINPLKNPQDPNAELKGIDSVSGNFDFGIAAINTVLILNKEIFTIGVDYNHLSLGSNISLYLDGLDIIVSGHYNFSDKRTPKVNSLAFGFKVDLFGIGLYGEAIILDGSRNKFPSSLTAEYKEDSLFNILVGAEYIFPTDTSLITEYYYNGEGYSKDERVDYRNYLISTTELYGMPDILHRSSNYSKHYFLLNISQPFYNINSTGNITTIYSVDTYNMTLTPQLSIDISENSNIELSYISLFDFTDSDLTEYNLIPMKNIFSASFKYAF